MQLKSLGALLPYLLNDPAGMLPWLFDSKYAGDEYQAIRIPSCEAFTEPRAREKELEKF
jgi:hypothetical protein